MNRAPTSPARAGFVQRAVQRLLRLPGWLWPVLVGVAVFQPMYLSVGPDSSWYWALAKNLHAGLGYVGTEWVAEVRRGPGLPLLLAASFRVFGEDASSTVWVVRAAFVASGLVTYALGARWFGRGVGVVAACGLMTNPIAGSIASTIGVDILGVALVLVAILALEIGGWRATALAALALVGTALTKESALLYLLPLGAHIALTRDRRPQLPMLAAAASAAFFALVLWSLWAGGGALVAQRVASFFGSGDGGTSLSIARIFGGLRGFAAGTAEGSWFWPWLVIGWMAVAYSAWRKASAPDRLMLWLGLSLVPIMVLQGLYALRPGQSYLLYPLSFLAFARAVQLAAQRYAPKLRLEVLAASAALSIAIGFAEGYPSSWLRGIWYGGSSATAAWTPNPLSIRKGFPHGRGWLNHAVDDAAAWLAENTTPDQTLVSDWYWADSLYIRTNAARPIHRIAYVRSRDVSHMALDTALEVPILEDYAPALFVFSQSRRTNPAHPDAWVNALSEPLLFARLEQVEADWLILTKRRMMLSDYFDASPSFELAHTGPGDLIKIYSVRRPLVATPVDTGVPIALGLYLDSIAEDDPAAYDALVADYFTAKLGVGAAEVAEWRDVLRAALPDSGSKEASDASD